jgi:multiple sugar transport system ATP-binding protein
VAEIILDNVSKRFPGGTLAVRNASFTIREGEFFIVVGPSGCGKSTVLNMIAGLDTVTEGEIRVDGKVVNDVDPKDRNMAMVFQSYAIYPHMTVRENMAFPLKLAKLSRDEITRRVEQAAAILELTELLERKPRTLSGGQRQRVAMGRAIVREPAAFLLDEPLSNLDAKLRVQMRTEIARIQNRLGITMVYVTHDQTEAMTLGDRVAVLRQGEVQQIGTPRELYEQPRNLFVAGFIGSPAMNFVPAEFDGDRIKLPMAELEPPEPLRACLSGKPQPLIAGIRPEQLHDAATGGIDPRYGPTFRAIVDVIEWLGADLYVHFQMEGGRIPMVARVATVSGAAEGKELELWLDARRLHLFDPETGENIGVRG